MVRVSVPAAAVAVACGITAGAYAVGQLNPPRFITPLYAVGGAHPTSGLAGFPHATT